MNECKKCKRMIKKALYEELNNEDSKFFYKHLKSCGECSKEFDELKNTLDLFKAQPKPEPDSNFMNDFWYQLEPKLTDKKQSLIIKYKKYIKSIRFNFTWKYQLAGAAAFILIGIFIGRYFISEQTTSTQFSIPGNERAVAEQPAVNIEAANYIERSKVLLLGLMNFDPATDDIETISLPKQKEISRGLLRQTAGLKTGLNNSRQQQLSKLVSDIELILLQIANLETKHDLSGIELIQDGVRTRGIFLKINIEEMKKAGIDSTPQNKLERKEEKKI